MDPVFKPGGGPDASPPLPKPGKDGGSTPPRPDAALPRPEPAEVDDEIPC